MAAMASGFYLIDTNILISSLRRKRQRWELLRRLVETGGCLACSVITIGELYAGMRAHEKERTAELLGGFEEIEVTGEIARLAGSLKNEWKGKGFALLLPEMMIAATAIVHGLTLVTENRKDFPMPQVTMLELGE